MEKEVIKISVEVIEKVMNYLVNKPWKEVNILIGEISLDITKNNKEEEE